MIGAGASDGIRKAIFAAWPPFANIRCSQICAACGQGESAQMNRAIRTTVFPLRVLVRRNT
jgi:hypothetical protein